LFPTVEPGSTHPKEIDIADTAQLDTERNDLIWQGKALEAFEKVCADYKGQ
jgi:hypothetical protein